MQRKRDSLVPVAEAIDGLDDPVQALKPAPQALHHYTRFDQVNQLVGASEADPDRGFMARMMVLCSLPRSNPGNRTFNTSASMGLSRSTWSRVAATNFPTATFRDCCWRGCVPRPFAPKAGCCSWATRWQSS